MSRAISIIIQILVVTLTSCVIHQAVAGSSFFPSMVADAAKSGSSFAGPTFKQIYAKEQAERMDEKIPNLDDCFCKLSGDVDECNCKIDYIDKFNNYKIVPRINALVSQHHFFRYIKLNLRKICQFWPDDAKCSLKDCHVQTCSEVNKKKNFQIKLKQFLKKSCRGT
jgi:hypothetical protein